MIKLIYLSVLFSVFAFSFTVVAYEYTGKVYFGVGAVVEELDEGIYRVKTKGDQANEGFVHTPAISSLDREINYQIDLKGKGTVYLKIEETDPRGKFLKEHRSPSFQLTEDWKTYNLKPTFHANTSQIDVFVLTSSKQKTEFSFK